MTMASHGSIVGVSHLDSRADQGRRRGMVAVAASRGSRSAQTVPTIAVTAGAVAERAVDSRSRHCRHFSRWASRAQTSSAPMSVSPRA
jgi:hypothetical protein